MNDNPYAPPRAAVSDFDPQPLIRPRNVVRAVRLLWLSFFCVFPATLYELINIPPDTTPLENIIVNVLAVGLAFVIAWVINRAAWRGRNWGRWVQTVLWILATFALVFLAVRWPRLDPDAMPWYLMVQYLVQHLINLIALVLLFSPTANAWYREMKRRG
jgi:NADH:ubiquinone oxidoreductase subunit 6 (subunit J)